MDGRVDGMEYSFSESGSTGTVTLHGWVGVWIFAFQLSFYTFNEDGVTLLMRRTGWARTYISHGNGWNDIAWFLWLACQVHIHYFHVKGLFVYQFSQISMTEPMFALYNSTGQMT
jgi:hypothetical protein